jgi:hypothetical protein
MILTDGKSKYSQKIMFNAPLFTTNLTWADLGTNPGHRGEVDDYSPEPWHYRILKFISTLQKSSSYLTVNILRIHCKEQPLKGILEGNICFVS